MMQTMEDTHNGRSESPNSGEEGEESDEEEIEPKLKYSRISNALQEILSNDSASCVAFHPKFICVGTSWGLIHLLDHLGNHINNISELPVHSVAVNQISIDAHGDHIASCSDDGKIFIFGLYNPDNNCQLNVHRLVRSVAIDPYYYKSGSGRRRFVTGDDRLVLYEKTFLSRFRPTILCDAAQEGGVKTIKWNSNGELMSWATHHGFRVYDMTMRKSLGLIKWSRCPKVDRKCHMVWKDEFSVIVGWANTVRVCMVHKQESQFSKHSDMSPYVVHLLYTFQTDFLVCGVGPLRDWLVVLGCADDTEGNSTPKEPSRPQLHVIEPASEHYTNLSTVSFSLREYQRCLSSNYGLECLVEENRFIIVSPKDLVVACPCDIDDRVEWLIEHNKHEEALDAVKTATEPLTRNSLITVGRCYLDHLLFNQDYARAAELCHQILGNDKKLFEREIFKFAMVHELRTLSKYLPLNEHDKFSPQIYEMVLFEYLKMDPEGFLNVVKKWPPFLYNVPTVINAVLEHLLQSEPKGNATLLEALAILYSHDGRHDKALAMYIKLQNKGVFELIKERNLYVAVHGMVEGLLGLDVDQALDTIVGSKIVQPEIIVKNLGNNKYYLFRYLDALNKRNTKQARPYHGALVQLYADFNRESLLPLLESSDYYPIQEALNTCKQRNFYPEMVHLLDRIGNTKEALRLIIHQLDNVEKAIKFCIKHNDDDLWDDLINYSINKPGYITYLLKRIGAYIDPRILIQRIQNDIEIPGLKEALVKMLHDFTLQVNFQEGCNQILDADYFNLLNRLVSMRQRGSSVDDNNLCGVCLRKVLSRCGNDANDGNDIVIFHCSHMFHYNCLPADRDSCTICTSKKSSLLFNNR